MRADHLDREPADRGEREALTLRLVRAAQGGDSAASEELLARYQPRIRRIVALGMGVRLRELEEEDDLVQEALLTTWRRLDSFTPRSEASFLHWVSTIVRNQLRDRARRQGARKRDVRPLRIGASGGSISLTESILEGRVPTPSAHACGRELEERLEESLLTLAEADREVIVLARLCGMEGEELAAALGLGGSSSARARLARALAKLSVRLGE